MRMRAPRASSSTSTKTPTRTRTSCPTRSQPVWSRRSWTRRSVPSSARRRRGPTQASSPAAAGRNGTESFDPEGGRSRDRGQPGSQDSGVSGCRSPWWVHDSGLCVGIDDTDLAFESIGIAEEQGEDGPEVSDELVSRTEGHQTSSNLLERIDRLSLQADVVDPPPSEHWRLPCRLLIP